MRVDMGVLSAFSAATPSAGPLPPPLLNTCLHLLQWAATSFQRPPLCYRGPSLMQRGLPHAVRGSRSVIVGRDAPLVWDPQASLWGGLHPAALSWGDRWLAHVLFSLESWSPPVSSRAWPGGVGGFGVICTSPEIPVTRRPSPVLCFLGQHLWGVSPSCCHRRAERHPRTDAPGGEEPVVGF